MDFGGIKDLDLASIITLVALLACGALIWYANRTAVIQKYREREPQEPSEGSSAKRPRPGTFAPRNAAYQHPAPRHESKEAAGVR